jgi:hypothetical protein
MTTETFIPVNVSINLPAEPLDEVDGKAAGDGDDVVIDEEESA